MSYFNICLKHFSVLPYRNTSILRCPSDKQFMYSKKRFFYLPNLDKENKYFTIKMTLLQIKPLTKTYTDKKVQLYGKA